MKKWCLASLGLCLLSPLSFANEDKHEIALYHDLLLNESDPYLREVISEAIKRELPLPKDIKHLWAQAELRQVLIQAMSVEQAGQLKLFSQSEYNKLSSQEKSAIWLKAGQNEAWSSSDALTKLSVEIYPSSPDWVQNLLLHFHLAKKSDQLLSKIDQKAPSDVERYYRLMTLPAPKTADLKYQMKDSSLIIRAKLDRAKTLPKEQQKTIVASFKNLPQNQKKLVIPFLSENEWLGSLKNSKNDEIRAASLRALLNKKWMEGQAMRVLKSKSWAEAHVLYEYFVSHPDKITAASFEKYWTAASPVGKNLLAAFLWKHPKAEVSKTLVKQVDKSKEKMMALRALYALPAHGQSEWLQAHIKAKKWDPELMGLAIDTLWQWKEVKKDDKYYIDIFMAQGYKNGGPGIESLLKLMGLSKHRLAVKLIASFFREVEEPVVEVDVAIEASGYHGSKEFLRTLKKFERDGNKDDVLLWAIERCEGKDTPFPESEELDFKPSPYFFNSLNGRD